jgi:hypothetical protein
MMQPAVFVYEIKKAKLQIKVTRFKVNRCPFVPQKSIVNGTEQRRRKVQAERITNCALETMVFIADKTLDQ